MGKTAEEEEEATRWGRFNINTKHFTVM